LPIALVAWFEGKSSAIIISILSAVIWFLADLFSGHVYSHLFIPIWNAAIRLGFFLIVVFFMVTIKELFVMEQELSRTDSLTEIPNRRAFYERAEIEIEETIRSQRPFSIAYIDVDNFKQVNDTLGHSVGDDLLYSVAQTIRKNIRSIDVVARFGGDEFAVLMAETDEDGSREAIERIYKHLMEMIQLRNWSATFSIGVVTWHRPPSNLDELLKECDNLMYSAKRNGKNMVKYKIL
jgi:diguanylate cyclase (GGDEF)-like protein